MKKFLIISCLVLVLCGCSNKKEMPNSIEEPIQIENVLAEDNYIILDVRTKDEYETGHIAEAINIPHLEIDENIDLDKEKVILVYCQSGGRSKLAKESLENLGYTVYDLGGINDVDLPKE